MDVVPTGSRPVPCVPATGTYRRHEPEKTALHGIVREHLETFLAEACGVPGGDTSDGDGYPRFVEREFRKYLDCGLLCHGFARLRCPECGYELLVAFSCKGKLCPSCLARRAGDTAAWLVDHLLPEADYRQWVLTFPWTMRFRLAADRRLLTELLGIFLRTLFTWQRRRGRERGIVAGLPPRGGAVGAVTFVQRFGGALNLNPHVHSVVPDGLFVAGSEDARGASLSASGGGLTFVSLPPPTTAEVEALTATVARRCTERLVAASEGGSDYLDPQLAALCEALFWSRNAPAGSRDIPVLPGLEATSVGGSGEREEDGLRGKPLCASVAGFSLHAAQWVPAQDREALERLCRYGLRAPFSQERLSRRGDGKVVYRLRRPWPHAGGHTHLVLDPLDFLRRLAALVSFPYSHQIRYHGVFARRSRWRKLLPPPPPSRYAEETSHDVTAATADVTATAVAGDSPPAAAAGMTGASGKRSRPRSSWAQLLRRVLSVDALSCPRCSSRAKSVPMVVLAFLTDPEVVGKILRHIGLPTTAPLVARARSSGEAQGFALFSEERDSNHEACESDGETGNGGGTGVERGPPG